MRTVTFQVSSIECALPVEQVREILEPPPVTRVPGAPAAFRGVTNLRGQVIPVLDVAARLGILAAERAARSCLLVTDPASTGGVACALAVDGVRGIEDFEPGDRKPRPAVLAPADWLAAIVVRDDRLVLLVDLERLLDDAAIRASRPLPPADVAALRGAGSAGRGAAEPRGAADREKGAERTPASAGAALRAARDGAPAARAEGSPDAPADAATVPRPVQPDPSRAAARSVPSPGATTPTGPARPTGAPPTGPAQPTAPERWGNAASPIAIPVRVSPAGEDAREAHRRAGSVGGLAGRQLAAGPPSQPAPRTAEPERDLGAAGASPRTASRSGGRRLPVAVLAAGAALVLLVALCRGEDGRREARAREERVAAPASPAPGGRVPAAATGSVEPVAPPPTPPPPTAVEAERPTAPAIAIAAAWPPPTPAPAAVEAERPAAPTIAIGAALPPPTPPPPASVEAERPAAPTIAIGAAPPGAAVQGSPPAPEPRGGALAGGRPAKLAPLRPGEIYEVVRGDTLWSISERMLLDPRRWPRIYDANREHVANPDLILPGQRFIVPEPAPPPPAARPRRGPAPRREVRRGARG